MGPRAGQVGQPVGIMGMPCINFSLSWRELDLEFCWCLPGLKVNCTNFWFAAWPPSFVHNLKSLYDHLFHLKVYWRRHFWFLNPALLCDLTARCISCRLGTSGTQSSKNDSLSPKMKSMWGTSITWSSFTVSWSIAHSFDAFNWLFWKWAYNEFYQMINCLANYIQFFAVHFFFCCLHLLISIFRRRDSVSLFSTSSKLIVESTFSWFCSSISVLR